MRTGGACGRRSASTYPRRVVLHCSRPAAPPASQCGPTPHRSGQSLASRCGAFPPASDLHAGWAYRGTHCRARFAPMFHSGGSGERLRSISAAPRLTAHDHPPISRRLRRATCWALVPATVRASRHHRRTGREAHLSTVEAGPQAAARIPCPHGHCRRTSGLGQPTCQGPQAPVGLSWGRDWPRPAD